MLRTIRKTPGRARAIVPRLSAMVLDDSLTELTDQPCGVQASPAAQDLSHLATDNMEKIQQEDTASPSSLQTTWATSDTMNKSCEKRLEQRVKRGSLALGA